MGGVLIARPRKYSKPKAKTITAEEEVISFFEAGDFDYGDALKEWMYAKIPKNMSIEEYLVQFHQKEIDSLEIERKLAYQEIDKKYDDRIDEIRRKMELVKIQRNSDSLRLKELWPQWREAFPKIKEPNKFWKDSDETVGWWVRMGYPLYYRDIYRLWPEMEGHS